MKDLWFFFVISKLSNWLSILHYTFGISFSSGHVDPGEDEYTTALRETREEAGFTENDLIIHKELSKTLQYQVKGKPKETIYWLAQLKDSSKLPTLSDEHTDFKFLAKQQAIEIAGYSDFAQMMDFFDLEIKKIHQLS